MAGEKTLIVFQNGALLFFPEIADQDRSDILNSVLASNLAALKKYNVLTFPSEWLQFYHNTLQALGWVLQDFQLTKFQSGAKRYMMAQVIEAVMQPVASAEELITINDLLNYLKELDVTDDILKLLQAWQSDSFSSGFFQMLFVSQAADGPLLHMVVIDFRTSQQIDHFLWINFDRSRSTVNTSIQSAKLNTTIYDSLRDQIIQKLQVANPKVIEKKL